MSVIGVLVQVAAKAAGCNASHIQVSSSGSHEICFGFPSSTDDAALARAQSALNAARAGQIRIYRRDPPQPYSAQPRTRSVEGDLRWSAPTRKATSEQLRPRANRVFRVVRWGTLLVLAVYWLYQRLKR